MWTKALEFITHGGPVMAPLFAVAALAFGLLYERWRFFRAAGSADAEPWLERLQGNESAAAAAGAAAETGSGSGGLLGEFMAATVQSADWRGGDRDALLKRHELEMRERLDRGLQVLGMLAALAPLLGLLGTVTGMIATFELMAAVGVTDSRGLSLGIAEALITTQVGLSVALLTLVGRRALAARAERFRQALHQLRAAALASHAGAAGPVGPVGAATESGHA